jgi:hypothetical protein
MVRGFVVALTMSFVACAPAPAAVVPPSVAVPAASGPVPADPPRGPPSAREVTIGVFGIQWITENPWSLLDEAVARACYEDALAKNPTLTGWVTYDVSTAPNGEITVGAVRELVGVPPSLAECTRKGFVRAVPVLYVSGELGQVYVRFR